MLVFPCVQLPDLTNQDAMQRFFLQEVQQGEELLAAGKPLSHVSSSSHLSPLSLPCLISLPLSSLPHLSPSLFLVSALSLSLPCLISLPLSSLSHLSPSLLSLLSSHHPPTPSLSHLSLSLCSLSHLSSSLFLISSPPHHPQPPSFFCLTSPSLFVSSLPLYLISLPTHPPSFSSLSHLSPSFFLVSSHSLSLSFHPSSLSIPRFHPLPLFLSPDPKGMLGMCNAYPLSGISRLSFDSSFLSLLLFFCPPKRGQGCLTSPSCLESQGFHLIPLSCLLSCFFLPSPLVLSVLPIFC